MPDVTLNAGKPFPREEFDIRCAYSDALDVDTGRQLANRAPPLHGRVG